MCSDAPDISGMNAAAVQNAEVGREQLNLAREQMALDRARQAEYDPLFKQILASSLEQQQLGAQQSAEQWKSYKNVWQPLETKLADTASNFDTPARRQAEADAATADVGMQFDAQGKALDRDLARSNITLGSGKALALKAGAAMEQAKASAGASTTARRQVEQSGIALVDNAAKFGRNMTSTGIETARLSLGAGQTAGGTMAQQQGVINSGLAGAQGFYGGAVNATQSAGSILGQVAGIQQQTNASNQSTMGSLVGAGASMYIL